MTSRCQPSADEISCTNTSTASPQRLSEQISLFALALAAIFAARQLERLEAVASVGFLMVALAAVAGLTLPLVEIVNKPLCSAVRRFARHVALEVGLPLIALGLRACAGEGGEQGSSVGHAPLAFIGDSRGRTVLLLALSTFATRQLMPRWAVPPISGALAPVCAVAYVTYHGAASRAWALIAGCAWVLVASILALDRCAKGGRAAILQAHDLARYAAMLGIVTICQHAEEACAAGS